MQRSRDPRAQPALELAQRLQLLGRPVDPVVQLGRDVRQQRGVPLPEQREHLRRGEMDIARKVLVPLGAVAGRALDGEEGGPPFPLVLDEGGPQFRAYAVSVVSALSVVSAQRARECDGVLQRECGARADGVVRGVGGVAEQDEIAVVPGPVGQGAEVQPLRAAVGVRPADQPVPVQRSGEEPLQQGQTVRLARLVEPEALPGLGEHSTMQVLPSSLNP